MCAKMNSFLKENPQYNYVISLILNILSTVLGGVYIFDITVKGQIEWLRTFQSAYFYTLIFLIFVAHKFYSSLFHEDDKTKIENTIYWARAYAQEAMLNAVSEQYVNDIAAGKDTDLEKVTSALKTIIDSKRWGKK